MGSKSNRINYLFNMPVSSFSIEVVWMTCSSAKISHAKIRGKKLSTEWDFIWHLEGISMLICFPFYFFFLCVWQWVQQGICSCFFPFSCSLGTQILNLCSFFFFNSARGQLFVLCRFFILAFFLLKIAHNSSNILFLKI